MSYRLSEPTAPVCPRSARVLGRPGRHLCMVGPCRMSFAPPSFSIGTPRAAESAHRKNEDCARASRPGRRERDKVRLCPQVQFADAAVKSPRRSVRGLERPGRASRSAEPLRHVCVLPPCRDRTATSCKRRCYTGLSLRIRQSDVTAVAGINRTAATWPPLACMRSEASSGQFPTTRPL